MFCTSGSKLCICNLGIPSGSSGLFKTPVNNKQFYISFKILCFTMYRKHGYFLNHLCIDSVILLHRNRLYIGKFYTVKEIAHLQIKPQYFIIL